MSRPLHFRPVAFLSAAFLFQVNAGCDTGNCAYIDYSVSPAFAKLTPAPDSIHVGERLRLDISLPFRLNLIDSGRNNHSDVENIKSYPNKFALIGITNQRTGTWSGQILPQIGGYRLTPYNAADSSHGELQLAEADTSALGAVEFIPVDTGTYVLQIDQITAGDGCTTFNADPTILNQNKHLDLYRQTVSSPAGPDYHGRFYYFRVVQ